MILVSATTRLPDGPEGAAVATTTFSTLLDDRLNLRYGLALNDLFDNDGLDDLFDSRHLFFDHDGLNFCDRLRLAAAASNHEYCERAS